MAIRSFKDKNVEAFFENGKAHRKLGWASLKDIALRKLDTLDYAQTLEDLRKIPGK